MNSRERVLTALQHQEPDRVPIVIGISNATGIKIQAYRRLKVHLGISSPDLYLYDWTELGTAKIDDAILERLCCDMRAVYDRLPKAVKERNQKRDPHTPFFDDWGIGQKEISPGEWFPAIHPLDQANSKADLENYLWPDMRDSYRFQEAAQTARQLASEGEYAVMGAPWLMFPLERAFALQGMERFLYNLGLNPDFAIELLRKVTDLCKIFMGGFLDAVGDYIDVIKIGDDLGMQDRLLISPEMYRRYIKPLHADYIAYIKARTNAQIFFHSDGDIFDLVEDLVEIGVNILNPIQTSAGKMSNLLELKKRFGKSLSFCGGIDTQWLLPFGSPEEIQTEVQRVIQCLGKGGGYLLAAVHTIPAETPPENILAMVDAIEKYGHYPLNS